MGSWTHGLAFGGQDGDDGDDGDGSRPPRHESPDNEIPVAVPIAETVGRGTDLAVALTAVRAYSTGLHLDLCLRLRTATVAESNALYDVFMGTFVRDGASDDRFLIGLEFADGRSVSNVDPWDDDGGAGPGSAGLQPQMMSAGGGGGGRRFDQTYWITPLPPPGRLRVICAWPSRGIAETSVLLDGTAIAEAGSRAEQLWPWEPPPREPDYPQDARLALPGWFADRNLGRAGGGGRDSGDPAEPVAGPTG